MATASKKVFAKAAGSMGKNATYEIDEKGIMTVKVDLNIRLGDSASGKTVIVATTSGNKEIEGSGGVVIGLNAYVKKS